MKKLGWIAILFLFLFVAELFVSCCDYKCEDPQPFFYSNQKLQVSNLDNSGTEPVISNGNTIPVKAYGLRIVLSTITTVCNDRRPFFIPSAYATSIDCGCPKYRAFGRDSVVSIQMFTKYKFDSTHLSNSDVSDYFSVYSLYAFESIGSYLNKKLVIDYRKQPEGAPEIKVDLLLMHLPQTGTKHSFLVKLTLSDGRVLEQETTEIMLE